MSTSRSLPGQKLSAVMSGLMGIVFGCSIVYIISRLIAAQRRIASLEQHITRKADDDVVVSLTTRMNSMCNETQKMLSSVSSEVGRALHSLPNEDISPTAGVCATSYPPIPQESNHAPPLSPNIPSSPRTVDVSHDEAEAIMPLPDVDAAAPEKFPPVHNV
jgi:hypothetical protein